MTDLRAADLSAFTSGSETQLWRLLGAQVLPAGGGTRFAVWAPNARQVQVIGDFDGWGESPTELQPVLGTGVWAGTVAAAQLGSAYQFRIRRSNGQWCRKSDPLAQYTQTGSQHGSIVYESSYSWGDAPWLAARSRWQPKRAPISIYEVHLGSWRQGLTYRDLAEQLLAYLQTMSFTHVEFLPPAEHPYLGSWGYHLTGLFAPQSRLGTPDDFRYLVDQLHGAGIGVIVDWVPGHFATDDWALAQFDGTALYEHPNPQLGWHPDWGSHIFNFGRPEVKSFLLSNAWWWIDQFHIDGLRVDAVASMIYLDYSRGPGEWTPNRLGGNHNLEAIDLLQTVNSHIHAAAPGVIMIAEESTTFPGVTHAVTSGGLGFDFKWNMGWMNDSLRYLGRDPIHRTWHHHDLTFAMSYADSEDFLLPISHDEVVHGKGSMFLRAPQAEPQKFANLRAFYTFMWAHPGKQLLFMGCEWGQRREFSEMRSLDWAETTQWGHRGLQRLVRDLNQLYRAHPALWEGDHDPSGFRWIDADDQDRSLYSFQRRATSGETIVCVINFSTLGFRELSLQLPNTGRWTEICNSDSLSYDGTGSYRNLEGVKTSEAGGGVIAIAPLSAILLRPAEPTA